MAAKHARHDMREDKNFKGTDPSETTAQYLYCDVNICVEFIVFKIEHCLIFEGYLGIFIITHG